MILTVNGNEQKIALETLEQLVQHYNLREELVVAEVNGEIIDRTEWRDYKLKAGLNIELVHFVGGG